MTINTFFMNKIYKFFPMLLMGCALTTACTSSDWDDHFDEAEVELVGVSNAEVYTGTINDYLATNPNLTKIHELFTANKVYESTKADGLYTFIVCENELFDAAQITDAAMFAEYSVADMAVAPSKLVDGSGISTRSGKTIWVYEDGSKLDERTITKVVKTSNGYIYVVDGILPVRLSVYEYLNSLDDEKYSRFKELVRKYEYKFFDRENSTPIGVGDDGRVIYDSVMIIKNTFLDRYDKDGVPTWNMRDEAYTTTVFIPNNYQVDRAVNRACDSIPVWLNRKPTLADTIKFEQWIVKACFMDKRLSAEEVGLDAPDFEGIKGYQEVIDEVADITTYKSVEPSWWRPSVQKANLETAVKLSNGVAYYCNALKIPNHIIIYRIKSRFFELWNNMSEEQQKRYFSWTNWTDPLIINDCQGQFDLAGGKQTEWPSMYYHNLCAIPTEDAMTNGEACSVVYSGLSWVVDEDGNGQICEVNIPKGEYFLRMGFKHSLLYSLSIGFDGGSGKYTWLKRDMNMHATGSNYHFDRGAASEVPHYGDDFGIAYPEGFDVDYWQKFDPKAIAYDTDGYTVGKVNMASSGNFKIKVESSDMATIYKAALDSGQVLNRDKKNVNQLMMYHWCLRPTHNNY